MILEYNKSIQKMYMLDKEKGWEGREKGEREVMVMIIDTQKDVILLFRKEPIQIIKPVSKYGRVLFFPQCADLYHKGK